MAWFAYMKNSNPDPSLTPNTNYFKKLAKILCLQLNLSMVVFFTYITCACDYGKAGKHYLGRRVYSM